MRAFALASLFCVGVGGPAQAAVAPHYQRQAELRAIVDDMAVVEASVLRVSTPLSW